jgi:DNA-binding transcriptional MerR regulator
MELHTINQVSKTYGISTRMLRYYEEIGLINSLRKDDYAYRVYDNATLSRLQQIIVLRKLRIPVKHIGAILENPHTSEAMDIFMKNIRETEAEINALSKIRDILVQLMGELGQSSNSLMDSGFLTDSSALSIAKTLSLSKNLIKESATMERKNEDVGTILFSGRVWRVLEEKDGKALILAENVVERRTFHDDLVDITWEHSEMRRYLNGEFFHSFAPEEQSRILETQISDRDNPWTGTKCGNPTNDKIFLLSYDEILKYFGDSGDMENRAGWYWGHVDGVGGVPIRPGTDFINDQFNNARRATDPDGTTAWWWLRSPGGQGQHTSGSVGGIGEIFVCGDDVYNHPHRDEHGDGGVRPAMWIQIGIPDDIMEKYT